MQWSRANVSPGQPEDDQGLLRGLDAWVEGDEAGGPTLEFRYTENLVLGPNKIAPDFSGPPGKVRDLGRRQTNAASLSWNRPVYLKTQVDPKDETAIQSEQTVQSKRKEGRAF